MTTSYDPLRSSVQIPLKAVVDNAALDIEVVRETLRPGALDLPVRWAHVSELRDPAPYLLGAELLLTAGVNLPADQQEVDAYVRDLHAAGITALGFGITPPLHEQLPDTLRSACARHGVPLLVISVRTPFLAVNRAVALGLVEAMYREQRYVEQSREALTNAATRGLAALAHTFGDYLGGWIVLLGAGTERAAEHGAPVALPARVIELVARVRSGTGIRSATTELDDGRYVVAQPVYPQARTARVLVVARRERFTETDRSVLAIGAALFGLVTWAGTDSAMLGEATTALLLGDAPYGAALRGVLGDGDAVRVVAAAPHGKGPGEVAAGYDWLRFALGTPLVQLAPSAGLLAIVRATPAERTLATLRENGWLAVVSSPHAPGNLAGALPEIRSLQQRANATGKPLIADEASFGLAGLVAPAEAARFAADVLEPVHALDAARPGNRLVETLRVWLANHGRWDPTAATLDVHRNSVRHRIKQIERALGRDLDDPEVRMELWFALRLAFSS